MKKGQIKMMETISVLLVFMIIITLIIIFYANVSTSTRNVKKEEITNLEAVQISQLISYMPEFQCSFKDIVDENCFDILKIDAFIDYTRQGNYDKGKRALNTTYYNLFKYSKITVEEVYPDGSRSWLIYERKPDKDRVSEKKSYIPISLYDAESNEYLLGMLNVTVYS